MVALDAPPPRIPKADVHYGNLLAFAGPMLLLTMAGIFLGVDEQSWVPLMVITGCGFVLFPLAWVFLPDPLPIRAFSWSFGCYVLASATTQILNPLYNTVFTMPDSPIFYNAIIQKFGPVPLVLNFRMGAGGLDATLSAYVSQFAFTFVRFFEPQCGPWPALVVNSLVGSIVVLLVWAIARLCYPKSRNAVLAATLFCALCPLYLMFAVEPIRDGFVTALSAGMLYAALLTVRDPRPVQMIVSILIIAALSYCMAFARIEFLAVTAIIIGGYGLAGFLFVRRTKAHAIVFGTIILLFLGGLFVAYNTLAPVIKVAENFQEFYLGLANTASQGLGVLIVKLPLPLKILAGYFTDLVFPIPLWAFIGSDLPPTVWLRSLNGIWIVLLTPAAFVGFLATMSSKSDAFVHRQSLAVLAIVFIVGGAMISATTMEVRHLSAFFPAFFVLAGVPIAIGAPISGLLRSTTRAWLGAVVFVHIVWAVLKFL